MPGAQLPKDHSWPPDDASLMETTASGDPDLVSRTQIVAVPEPGDRLGPYIVEGTLGAGAMGVVYRAVDPDRQEQVAVKLIHRWRTDPHGESAEEDWLRHEAGALARLSHPNVVAVLGVGTFDDRPFLAMELVEGQTLSDWLGGRPRHWREIVPLLRDAARGLAAVHSANLVHGDFKPDNVMVGDDGRVRVMDFGLARSALAPENRGLVQVDRRGVSRHQPIGTPAYMAPEQLAGRQAEARSDQFACCVTLYEALFSERPFPGRTPAELAYHVMRGERRQRPKKPAIPSWLYTTINRGLAVAGAARWPSMTALADALDRGLQEHRG